MHRNGHNSTSGQILTQNLLFPWTVSYLTTNFGCTSAEIYVFGAKNSYRNIKFGNLGASRDGYSFLVETSNRLISRVFSPYACSVQVRSWVFFIGVRTKKGHYKKSERLYFIYRYTRRISCPTKFNKNWRPSSVRRRNQSHQVL